MAVPPKKGLGGNGDPIVVPIGGSWQPWNGGNRERGARAPEKAVRFSGLPMRSVGIHPLAGVAGVHKVSPFRTPQTPPGVETPGSA